MGRRRRKKRRKVEKVVNISVDPGFLELTSWLRELGFQACQHLRPALFPGTGRGLQATSPIAPGSVLVSVPLAALVTRHLVLALPGLAPAAAQLPTRALLALWLCLEAASGPWGPYLASLPRSYSNLFFASQQERLLLPGHLQDRLREQRAAVDRDYSAVAGVTGQALDRDRFDWAWFTVNTRAVYLASDPRHPAGGPALQPSDRLALAPYLDMLNHSSEAVVSAGLHLDPSAPAGYQIVTHRRVRRGEQVFISYGAHTNSALLLEYGFMLPHNIQDGLELELVQLEEYVTALLCRPPCPALVSSVRAAGLHRGLALSPAGGLSWAARACLALLLGEVELATVYSAEEAELEAGGGFLRHLAAATAATLAAMQAVAPGTEPFQLAAGLVAGHLGFMRAGLATAEVEGSC